MIKQVSAMCAAALLAGGIASVPGTSMAAAPSMAALAKKATLSNEDSNSGRRPVGGNGGGLAGGYTGTAVDSGQTGNGGNGGSKYGGGNGGNDESSNGAGEGGNPNSAIIDRVIAEGMKYIGTPYLFGSNRSTTETFDCSDFVRWIYKEKADLLLPADSRHQGAFVKKHGTARSDWHRLKRGDLMFFMTYKGSTAADYRGIDKTTERITHVALYLGNGKILHTYSNASGGVHVQSVAGSQWEHRFLFGGSVLT